MNVRASHVERGVLLKSCEDPSGESAPFGPHEMRPRSLARVELTSSEKLAEKDTA
jgi:hypothetical protein